MRVSLSLVNVCLVAVVGACDRPPTPAASLASRIELATGDVSIKQPEAEWQRAIAGMLLRHGAEVRVGPGDRALIKLDNGSAVFLRNGTQVRLHPERLELISGEAWVDAPEADKQPAQYSAGKVSVTAANAGFDLLLAKGKTQVYVARGLAVLDAPGGRSEVQAGERATVTGKDAPKVQGVSFWEDWTGGMADQAIVGGMGGVGSGRIYAIDRARRGAPPKSLEVRSQRVQVVLRDGVARTTVDQTFFNPHNQVLEGYYWFTLPAGTAVDRFALEVNGALVEGEVTERQQAAAAYQAAVQSAFDPALLEWVDGRTFRARIYPLPAAGERRVVLSYLELLPTVDRQTRYVYPMGSANTRVQEFSLSVDLGDEGPRMKLATTADARIEEEGRRVSMRRSGFKPQGDFLLEMTAKRAEPLRAFRVESSREEAAYVMLRYVPELDWGQLEQVPGDVVIVVDTSAGGDDSERQLRSDAAEAILRALSQSDRFALVAVDLAPQVLYPQKGLAPANEEHVSKALERLSGVIRGGATDIGALFNVALKRLHGASQPAVVYVGDGVPTVGELDGEKLATRLTRSMAASPARLFTIAVGADANHALLSRLARIGGGQTLRIDLPEQAVQEALRFVGELKTPTLTDLKLDVGAGLDQAFMSSAGKLSRGQEVVLLARTHHTLPSAIKVTGKLGGKPFAAEHSISEKEGAEYAYVPKLWARRYLTHLLGTDQRANRGTIIRLGLDYALMTPFTSFLVLENDAAYQRYGIQRRPRDPLWGLVPHAALEVLAAAPLAVFGCGFEPASDRKAAPATTAQPTEPSGSAARALQSYDNAKGFSPSPMAAEAPPRPSKRRPGATRAGAARGRRHSGKFGMADSLSGIEGQQIGEAHGYGGLGSAAKRLVAKPEAKSGIVAASPRDEEREADRPSGSVVMTLETCSDASSRPLMQRRAIWQRRLDRSGNASTWVRVYRRAAAQCELSHWRDRKTLLDLVQQRIGSANEARVVLASLQSKKARAFLRRRLLQRAVDARFVRVLQGGDSIDWSLVDAAFAGLGSPAQRVQQLRKLCSDHPGSRQCKVRLVRELIKADQAEEALALALRMRTDGTATPQLMRMTGDLLAAAKRPREAMRAYSELVEFAPNDPTARRLLGDIYLARGWHDSAYRQYNTLCQMRPNDPLAQLRLAGAAAGTGRVDQALRIERKVSAGEGEPGPRDPRRWARLWSAARLARLMLDPKTPASAKKGMERTLRRLQVLTSPGVLVLVTWEDLDARLALRLDPTVPSAVSLDASDSGLLSLSTGPLAASELTAQIQLTRAREKTPVRFQIAVLTWDGQRLRVANHQGITQGKQTAVGVALPR